MRKIYLGSYEVTFSCTGLIITSEHTEPGEVNVILSPEETYNFLEFLYQHHGELYKMSHQAPTSQNIFENVASEQGDKPDQLDDWIDWERHLSN